MYIIKIEKGDNWKWKEMITISPGQKSASLTHSINVFDKKVEPVRTSITRKEYDVFLSSFEAVDFNKVYKENKDKEGPDGWTLSCEISNGIVHIGIGVWVPSTEDSNQETLKLLEACNKVFAILGEL